MTIRCLGSNVRRRGELEERGERRSAVISSNASVAVCRRKLNVKRTRPPNLVMGDPLRELRNVDSQHLCKRIVAPLHLMMDALPALQERHQTFLASNERFVAVLLHRASRMRNCRGDPEDGDDAPWLDAVHGDRLIDLQRFGAIEDVDLAPATSRRW
jgi:hypothetical protein